jgi:hypothetical protein
MKISFALIDKSISFSARKPFKMLAERRVSRREATSLNLQNPDWRYLLDKIRTFFDENPDCEF